MRAMVILNPEADLGRARELQEKILFWGNQHGGLDLETTNGPGHASRLSEEAVLEGYELIAAAGGDGTIHEVINGLLSGDRARARLGLIPIGSGNDFAYGLGLLSDPETSVRRLFTGRPRSIDLARISDDRGRQEVVANSVGIGFDAAVSIQSSMITRLHGFAMYAVAALKAIALHFQAPHLEINFDDEVVQQQALLLAIGIGPRAGGGFFLTPNASFDDNLLDTCTVNPVGRATMLRMLPRVMKGTHITSEHVTMRRSKRIDVSSDIPLPIHVDGEIFAYPEDNVRRVTITSLPRALEVMDGLEIPGWDNRERVDTPLL